MKYKHLIAPIILVLCFSLYLIPKLWDKGGIFYNESEEHIRLIKQVKLVQRLNPGITPELAFEIVNMVEYAQNDHSRKSDTVWFTILYFFFAFNCITLPYVAKLNQVLSYCFYLLAGWNIAGLYECGLLFRNPSFDVLDRFYLDPERWIVFMSSAIVFVIIREWKYLINIFNGRSTTY